MKRGTGYKAAKMEKRKDIILKKKQKFLGLSLEFNNSK